MEIRNVLYTTALRKEKEALGAYSLALKIAQDNGASLYIMHCLTPLGQLGEELIKEYVSKERIEEVKAEGVKKVYDKIRERIRRFHVDNLSGGVGEGVRIVPVVKQGKHSEEIRDAAIEYNIDIIVMGGGKRYNFTRYSRTVGNVLRESHVPVIVVPMKK